MVSKAELFALAENEEQELDWEAMFEEQFPRVYNYLRYRTTSDALAEDLAAETFARAWRSRKQYRADRAAFSTWLFTIGRNLAIDHLRQQRPQVALEDIPEPAEDEEHLEEMMQNQQNARRLATLLAELPQRELEIIALRYGADLSHRQIARVLRLSSVNVRVTLFRTVRKLRARWERKP